MDLDCKEIKSKLRNLQHSQINESQVYKNQEKFEILQKTLELEQKQNEMI